MRKLFKERKLIKGGNYMRKYGMHIVQDYFGVIVFTYPYFDAYRLT